MNKVLLLIPYFGQWPPYIELYLYSCSRQRGIDFMIFTDCKIPACRYDNVIFKPISFEDYCLFVSERLSIPFKPACAYKLCDLKPFYGVVHMRELDNYDWWGFGDVDLVYGNLSFLVNESNMRKYELLTTHMGRVAGHFTVIRKDSIYTHLCLKIPHWQNCLCTDNYYALDERIFSRIVMTRKYKTIKTLYHMVCKPLMPSGWKYYCYYRWGQILRFWDSRILMMEYFTSFKPAPDVVCYYNLATGDITCSDQQLDKISSDVAKLYLHFLFFKKTPYYETTEYWKDNYYGIPQDYDFSSGGVVEISTKGMRVRKAFSPCPLQHSKRKPDDDKNEVS